MKSNIEYRNLKDLKLLENNPRKISKESMEQLIKSITDNPDYFEARPIILSDRTGELVIIAGNQRYKAAKKIGLKQVPTFLLSGLTEEREREIVIRDNVSNGEWDNDILRDEWGMCPLEDWGVSVDWKAEEEPKEAKEDDFSEEDAEQAPAICQKGDIWQLGEHRLMCGDSTDIEQVKILMGGVLADMVFTDPPYGVSYTGGVQFGKDGSVKTDNRQMILNDEKDIYEDVFKTLKEITNGPCYIWFADTRGSNLYKAAEKYGDIHSLIIWVKNGGYGALMANYKQKHEPCLYWKPKGAKLNFIGSTTETTIWDINKDGINKLHPTQKPIALSSKAIVNHKANSVLDLFGGSGSTMMACEQLNRKCYMMELDPHYCDVIIARWEKLTGKQAVKIN